MSCVKVRLKSVDWEFSCAFVSFQCFIKRPGSAYVSEIHCSELSQSADDLTADVVGDVQLGQRHLGRAKEGIFGSHASEMMGVCSLGDSTTPVLIVGDWGD
jgi:hypothetical protein